MELLHAYLIPVVNGFAYGLLLFTVAAGLTLAFGVADVLNLAHGTVYVAGGFMAVWISDGSWTGLALAVLAGAVVGAGSGGLLSVAVAPLSRRGHLAQALLTFGIALIGGAALVMIFGADELRPRLPEVLTEPISLLGHSYSAYRLGFITVAALLALIGWLVMARTTIGARVRATIDDREMVASLGTNPRLVFTAVMVAAGALAGFAGAIGAPIIGPGPATAHHVLLTSLVIVVLGGLGSIGGAFVAAIVVGQLQSVGVVALPDGWAPYLVYGAMAIALLVRRPEALRLGGAR